MEYSIHELSNLSGVTTRTLRWYDEIGLLKPSRVAESGYRYYGSAEVDRLQNILYYRALGVELARIRECLDDPSFDRLAALRDHLAALESWRAQLDSLIGSVRETIRCEERKERMSDEKKFEVLKRQIVERHEALYGREARQKYGERKVAAAQRAVLDLTAEQYQRWKDLEEQILQRLEAAVQAGLSPDGEEGRAITALHREWLAITSSPCDPDKHRGIAALYMDDSRLTAYYDRNVPGCAHFLWEAVTRWAG